MMRLLLCLIWLVFAPAAHAENWQILGESSIGKHLVDYDSMVWNANQQAFDIQTKVMMPDSSEWKTTMNIACKTSMFFYVSGEKTQDQQVVTSLDKPTKPEKIVADSMPDSLKNTFCEQSGKLVKWQLIGESNVASVYYDAASIQRDSTNKNFTIHTKVEPFTKLEASFSHMQFDCNAKTFTLLKMLKVKDGKNSVVFDQPQLATSVSKTATLEKLANKFCQ